MLASRPPVWLFSKRRDEEGCILATHPEPSQEHGCKWPGENPFQAVLGHPELPASQCDLPGAHVAICHLIPFISASGFPGLQKIGAAMALRDEPMQSPAVQMGKPKLGEFPRSLSEAETELELEAEGQSTGQKETVSYLLADIRPHGSWGFWVLPLKLGVTQVRMLDLGACRTGEARDSPART